MGAARLLDVNAAADYLGGISASSVRGLVARGELVPVRLPSLRHPDEQGRRLLFAREDLDTLVERWRRSSSGAPNPGLSAASVKGWKLKPVRKRKLKTGASA